MNRKIKLLLIVSLLLNVLLAGMVTGHMMHRFAPSWGTPAEAVLSPEKQALVHSVMHKAFEENKPLRDEIRQTQDAMGHILESEPFDEAAYDAQTKKLHTLHQLQSQHMAEAFKSLARQMNPSERAALADMLRHPPEHKSPVEEPRH